MPPSAPEPAWPPLKRRAAARPSPRTDLPSPSPAEPPGGPPPHPATPFSPGAGRGGHRNVSPQSTQVGTPLAAGSATATATARPGPPPPATRCSPPGSAWGGGLSRGGGAAGSLRRVCRLQRLQLAPSPEAPSAEAPVPGGARPRLAADADSPARRRRPLARPTFCAGDRQRGGAAAAAAHKRRGAPGWPAAGRRREPAGAPQRSRRRRRRATGAGGCAPRRPAKGAAPARPEPARMSSATAGRRGSAGRPRPTAAPAPPLREGGPRRPRAPPGAGGGQGGIGRAGAPGRRAGRVRGPSGRAGGCRAAGRRPEGGSPSVPPAPSPPAPGAAALASPGAARSRSRSPRGAGAAAMGSPAAHPPLPGRNWRLPWLFSWGSGAALISGREASLAVGGACAGHRGSVCGRREAVALERLRTTTPGIPQDEAVLGLGEPHLAPRCLSGLLGCSKCRAVNGGGSAQSSPKAGGAGALPGLNDQPQLERSWENGKGRPPSAPPPQVWEQRERARPLLGPAAAERAPQGQKGRPGGQQRDS